MAARLIGVREGWVLVVESEKGHNMDVYEQSELPEGRRVHLLESKANFFR